MTGHGGVSATTMTDDTYPLDDEDELEITLRPPSEVGARIILVAALCRRAMFELSPDDVDDAEGERFDLAAWIREEGLASMLSADERQFLEMRVGGLSRELAEDITWNVERLAMLAWGANIVQELPAFTEQSEPRALLDAVPSPWDPTRTFLKSLVLRSEEDVALAREGAEIWYWRLTLESEMRFTTGKELTQLRSIVRDVAREAAESGIIDRPVSGDFGIEGVPVGKVPLDELSHIEDIVAERLRALNWLCGFGASWADAPLEVE